MEADSLFLLFFFSLFLNRCRKSQEEEGRKKKGMVGSIFESVCLAEEVAWAGTSNVPSWHRNRLSVLVRVGSETRTLLVDVKTNGDNPFC